MQKVFLLILFLILLSCKTDSRQYLNNASLANDEIRIGKITFNVANEIVEDSIVEYLKIDGKEYANQIWLVNKNKDTIGGNYFNSLVEDTSKIGTPIRLRFYLSDPTINYESDMYVLLPYDDDELEEDYSNFFEIQLDTFPSLKNDGIPHPELADLELPLHHISEFALDYSNSGEKRVRGVIIERGMTNEKKYERRLFFDKSFYISE